MRGQQEQLECLRDWLTATEDRISHMAQVGPDLADLEQQLAAHGRLQADLEAQQTTVDSLCNLVVVVDDSAGDYSMYFH